jgi:dolichol-phosphate mannosyltransferase
MLSIIIPVYNERENIEELANRIKETMINKAFEIVFIDDSNDDTLEIINKLALEDPRIKLEHRINETGLATAVLRGFEIANGDILSVMDADLQHPPEILKAMLQEIEAGADLVIPSRFIKGGDDGGLNIFRKFVSDTARYLGKTLLSKVRPISDPTGGLFMFKRKVIEGKELKPIGWKILIEILVIGNYNNVVQIPYKFVNRGSGRSKFTLSIQFQYLLHIASLIKRSRTNSKFYVLIKSIQKYL